MRKDITLRLSFVGLALCFGLTLIASDYVKEIKKNIDNVDAKHETKNICTCLIPPYN